MQNFQAKLCVYAIITLSLPTLACDSPVNGGISLKSTQEASSTMDSEQLSTTQVNMDATDPVVEPTCVASLVWQCSIATAYPQFAKAASDCADLEKFPDACSQQICTEQAWADVQDRHQVICLQLACPLGQVRQLAECEAEYRAELIQCMVRSNCDETLCQSQDVIRHVGFIRKCLDEAS